MIKGLWRCLSVAVCYGTDFELRRTGHAGNWSYQKYIRMYENCVYVDGNLELTYLENDSYDLSFLSNIREVKYMHRFCAVFSLILWHFLFRHCLFICLCQVNCAN